MACPLNWLLGGLDQYIQISYKYALSGRKLIHFSSLGIYYVIYFISALLWSPLTSTSCNFNNFHYWTLEICFVPHQSLPVAQ